MKKFEFGEWLRIKMAERGLSQTDLAKRSGITPSQISRLIKGYRGVGEESLKGIAIGLRLPPETVFRAAGLLPEEISDEAAEALAYRISLLPEEEQVLLDALIETMLSRQQKGSINNATRKAHQAT